jgi:7 transmembrane receptor (rhodopsin family)
MTDYLGQVSIQLARAIIPAIIVVGVVGNLINITILTRSTLYNHSCSRYFLMLSISSLAYLSINLIYRLLADGYQLDPTRSSILGCKMITYVTQVCYPMPPYFIVLASFDRFCVSSPSAQVRKFSSTSVSRRAILILVSFFLLLYINTALVVDLRFDDGLGCRNRGDTVLKQVFAVVQCVLFAIVAPILMVLFGVLTICNAKHFADGRALASRYRRTERQLVAMLLVQVATHILLTMPLVVIYTLLVLPTTYKATRFVYFTYSVFSFPFHLSYASAFPLHFLSGRLYRHEFLRVCRRIWRRRVDTRITPLANASNIIPISAFTQSKMTPQFPS